MAPSFAPHLAEFGVARTSWSNVVQAAGKPPYPQGRFKHVQNVPGPFTVFLGAFLGCKNGTPFLNSGESVCGNPT